tara:strand:+ start:157 stop:564 length:408 start_codon:yes stop_codon:yes gene_type:complete
MPGKSKKGGGLEVGSAYKMKNSALHMGAKHGTPIQANYGAPTKDYSVEKGSHDHPHSPTNMGHSPVKENPESFKPREGYLLKKKTLDPSKGSDTKETQKNTKYWIGTTPSDSTSYYQHKENLIKIGKKYLADKNK